MNGEGIYVGSGDERGDDTHNVTIRGNHIWDTTDEGIELKGSTSNCVVEHNIVHDLLIKDGGGIVVSTPDFSDPRYRNSGHIIAGNIVYNVETRTSYSDGNGLNIRRGALVYNNVSYGNQHYGIRVDDKLSLSPDISLFHNTLHDNGSGALGTFDGLEPDVRNNIGPSSTGNVESSAAMFKDALGGDFHLVAGASPVDFGVDVGIDIDLEDNPRPQGRGFDMGAYEQ